jgi:hypothetical protein
MKGMQENANTRAVSPDAWDAMVDPDEWVVPEELVANSKYYLPLKSI